MTALLDIEVYVRRRSTGGADFNDRNEWSCAFADRAELRLGPARMYRPVMTFSYVMLNNFIMFRLHLV